MKKIISLVILVFSLWSCGEEPHLFAVGHFKMELPEPIKLTNSGVPEAYAFLYKSFDVYSAENEERVIAVYDAIVKTDTVNVQVAFESILATMLIPCGKTLNDLEGDATYFEDMEQMEAQFHFELNGETTYGYAFMAKYPTKLESVWLVPLKRGFSKDEIKAFKKGFKAEAR